MEIKDLIQRLTRNYGLGVSFTIHGDLSGNITKKITMFEDEIIFTWDNFGELLNFLYPSKNKKK